MGSVYAVTRLGDGRRLAMKLARELNGVALARLAREAQVACSVSHPNLVTVLDVDVASSGFLYIVMELVEGPTLTQHRDRFGMSDWAVPILAQIAEGLAALHDAGVVHRDLKPSNVLITKSADGTPHVKIADFGISLRAGPGDSDVTATLGPPPAADRTEVDPPERSEAPTAKEAVRSTPRAPRAGGVASSSVLTGTGLLPGTPAYIAPELVSGRDQVTAAADLFAFGVIAYEMLTARRPFTEPPALALMEGRPAETAPSIISVWPWAIAEVAAMVDACLSHDPRRRPAAKQVAGILGGARTRRAATRP